ncbi:MAG: GIY-YIG nuclease family protein, partial [Nitrospiraceae bacterium]
SSPVHPAISLLKAPCVRGQMGFYVYIIQSQKDSSLYIGQTGNLQDRMLRHNQGRSSYTKGKRPWSLLYSERFETRSQAVRKEHKLKSFHRKDLLLNLIRSVG